MDGNFEDDFASMAIFIGFHGPEEPERYAADAENILQRLNDNPNLGPELFVLTREDDPLMHIAWENNRFNVALYAEDYNGHIGYMLVIDGKDHGPIGSPATEEQETEFREHAREIVAAFQSPTQGEVPTDARPTGARRRRNRRKTKKTKKVSKKRRSTRRRGGQ
jgi:hypothetical protein